MWVINDVNWIMVAKKNVVNVGSNVFIKVLNLLKLVDGSILKNVQYLFL